MYHSSLSFTFASSSPSTSQLKRQLGSEAEVLNDSSDSSNCVSNNNNINNNNPISSKKVKLELDSTCSPSSSDTSQVVTVATSSLTTSSTSPTAMTTLNGTSSHDPLNGTLNSGEITDDANANSGNSIPIASKVVHIRNISSEANESDLMNLGLPFGKIANILLLKGKNQGLIEFQDLSSAQCMVSYWQMNSLHSQPTVRGRHVYCQFSNHQQLNKQQSDTANNSSNGHMSPNTNPFNSNNSSNNNNSDLSATETSVLRVVVDQLLYPVTLENFHQLFSRYGKVTKIVTFQKNASLQALIQFESVSYAVQAKNVLDGSPMFGSQTLASNILRVSFSKLTNLNVKYNNDKSRDYTNPNLPSGIPNTGSGSGGYTGSSGEMGHMAMDPITLAGEFVFEFKVHRLILYICS